MSFTALQFHKKDLLPRCQNHAPLWRTSVVLDPGSVAKMVPWDDNNATIVKQVNLFGPCQGKNISTGEYHAKRGKKCMKMHENA